MAVEIGSIKDMILIQAI